ncbi:hypothetical protein [Pseudactinotalea terrae]|uniref:hypothetical protein n=1 Tax=Pseudactinotalea terrae TaxID=1743262 RepID=UPI0012E28310|nr:hypothetical protein [Pseudactinotalea terrae]
MGSPQSTPISGIAYRRQFVMGPEAPDLLAEWSHESVTAGLTLSVHPDLPSARVDAAGRSIVLLGYVLDPRHPARDDATILADLLRTTTTYEDVLRAFDELAGRWVACYLQGEQVRVFHDAAGLRQVYYGHDDDGALWCGSRPELLARLLGRPEDVETRRDLTRDGVLSEHLNHFWPGSGSAFVGIHRLLPNHDLEVMTGQVRRYWPVAPIEHREPEAASARAVTTLQGVISAAAARYPLALAVTAGFDSRVLLAASREHVQRMTFYTFKKPGMTTFSPDIQVPRHMLKKLGLTHKVIHVRHRAPGPVAATIAATFTPAHQKTADQAAALDADPPRDRPWVTLNGNVAETVRAVIPRREPTRENLALIFTMQRSEYAAATFERWYDEARSAIAVSGINLWDFFYWEQRLSAWLATVRTEFDVVEEGVTPYNSRALLECLMGVDEGLRCPPDYTFFGGLVGRMWPQLLDFPVNPPDRVAHGRRKVRSTVASLARPVVSSLRRR